VAGIAVCVYIIFLLVEFIRAARSMNRVLKNSEGEIDAMLADVSKTVNLTTAGIQDLIQRIRFFSAFLEVLGVVSNGVDVFKSKTKQTVAPSKVAVLSALAGFKRAFELLLGEKK
jgi:uncharacterized protein YoxC